MNKTLFSRSQVCEMFNITLQTLRHYENLSLISPFVAENKYKYYTLEQVEIINVILMFRKLHISLSDIKKLLSCSDLDMYISHINSEIISLDNEIQNLIFSKNDLNLLKGYLDSFKKHRGSIIFENDITLNVVLSQGDISNKANKILSERFMRKSARHINFISIKIVDNMWLYSNGNIQTNIQTGYICNNTTNSTIYIKNSISIYTYDNIEHIPSIISKFRNDNANNYNFTNKTYIIELNAFGFLNEGKLIRIIIFEYIK